MVHVIKAAPEGREAATRRTASSIIVWVLN
jgi:hypothetical protein